MDRGLDWYKRDPIEFLDGVQGMGPELIGAYAVIVDLLYARAGQTPRDDRHLSGVLGCSLRKAKSLTDQLVQKGKITTHDGFITNSRAFRQSKSRRELSETRAEAGRKGGEKSAEVRKNSNLPEPNASSKTQPEENREEENKSKKEIYKETEISPLFGEQQKKRAPSKPKIDAARSKLIEFASPDAVDGYLQYRKTSKAKGTTERAAGMIAKQLTIIAERGGDPDEALDMAQLQGWQGIQADWYFNKKGQDNGTGNSNHNGAANGRGMAGGTTAAEIADRATRYAQSRATGGGAERDFGDGQRQD